MNKQLFEYHPVIGYKFIPNLKTRIQHEGGGYLIQTNNLGFRSDKDYFKKKKSNKKRVLVFGDSFTAGDSVSNSQRYTEILEKLIPNLEIYNLGLSGSGTDQQYLIYKEYGEQIEHDIVIITVLVENIRRVNARYRYFYNDKKEKLCYQKPYFKLVNDELELYNVPVPKTPIPYKQLNEEQKKNVDKGGEFEQLRKFVINLGLKKLAQKVIRYQPVSGYSSKTNPQWLLLKAILQKWISECTAKVVIVPLPLYQFVEEINSPKNYQNRFQELANETKGYVHDPLPDLLKYPKEERRKFRFEHDIHPTPLAHKAYANSISKILDKL